MPRANPFPGFLQPYFRHVHFSPPVFAPCSSHPLFLPFLPLSTLRSASRTFCCASLRLPKMSIPTVGPTSFLVPFVPSPPRLESTAPVAIGDEREVGAVPKDR